MVAQDFQQKSKENSLLFAPRLPLLPTVTTGLFTLIVCVYLTGFSIFTPAKRRLSAVVSGYGAAEGNSAFLYLLIAVRRAKAARAL